MQALEACINCGAQPAMQLHAVGSQIRATAAGRAQEESLQWATDCLLQ